MSSAIRRGPPQRIDLPPAQPTPTPRADHTDFSEEALTANLDRLEGWKPTEEDVDLAKEWIEWLDKSIECLPELSPLWIRTLRRLAATCRRSEQLPSSLRMIDHNDVIWLHGDQEFTNLNDRKPLTHHGQADIFKCKYEGRAVAVKDYRISTGDSMKNFFDEIVLWSRLTHRNIVPFIGRLTAPKLALASEWMANEDLVSFLERNPGEDRTPYFRDIMAAVFFLHSLGIIHADLKGANILVDGEKRALLADFGISQTSSYTHTQGWWARGTDSYKAPEYQAGDTVATKESDFFAMAHMFVELFLPPVPAEARLDIKGKKTIKDKDLPEEIKQRCLLYPNTNKSIPTQIEQRIRPKRPEEPAGPGLTDELWYAIERAWDDDPKSRWDGWVRFLTYLEVPLPEFDMAQAQSYAARIREEDAPPPGSIEEIEAEQGMITHPTWEDWPHTYGKPTPYLVYRHLTPLLDFRDKPVLPPIIDLSFHKRLFLQEDSINPGLLDKHPTVTPIEKDELEQEIYAEEQDHAIRYIEIKCALIPGWRAKINAKSLRAGSPRPPSPPPPVFISVEQSEQDNPSKSFDTDVEHPHKSGFLCGLLPRRLLGGSRASNKSSQSSRIEKEDTSSISDAASHEAKSRPPSPAPPAAPARLEPPVSEDELATLKPLTVGDVFTGLWNAMHESVPEEAYAPYTPAQRAKFNKLQFRRARRAVHPKPSEKRAFEDFGVIYADLLVDEVMFDGFVVTDVDGRGGMELELLTRVPKQAELDWYRDMQR